MILQDILLKMADFIEEKEQYQNSVFKLILAIKPKKRNKVCILFYFISYHFGFFLFFPGRNITKMQDTTSRMNNSVLVARKWEPKTSDEQVPTYVLIISSTLRQFS